MTDSFPRLPRKRAADPDAGLAGAGTAQGRTGTATVNRVREPRLARAPSLATFADGFALAPGATFPGSPGRQPLPLDRRNRKSRPAPLHPVREPCKDGWKRRFCYWNPPALPATILDRNGIGQSLERLADR